MSAVSETLKSLVAINIELDRHIAVLKRRAIGRDMCREGPYLIWLNRRREIRQARLAIAVLGTINKGAI